MVRCNQSVLENPPPIGTIITVKHSGNYANGRHKQPIFWRERKDTALHELTLSKNFTEHKVAMEYSFCYIFLNLEILSPKRIMNYRIKVNIGHQQFYLDKGRKP